MAFIYNLTDSWNDVTTTWNGIKLAVTNTASSASSNLLNLTVTGATTASFVVDKSGNLALNGSVNKITMTAPATGATLTLADGSSFITSGAHSATFTFSATTALTFPTSGTVTALGNTSTGSGSIVLATSPTLVSPALGTPSSGDLANCTGYPASGVTGTLAIVNGGTGQTTANAAFNALAPSQGGNSGKYLTTDGTNTSWASNPLGTVTSVDVSGGSTGLSFSGGPITTSGTITMAGTLAVASGGTGITSFGTGVATALGVNVGSAGAFVENGGALGTPSSGTLTNATGLPISTGVSGLGTGVATFLATPSSANLASAVTDETGSGPLVFATSPTIGSPTITGTATFNGSSSGTVAVKAPSIAGTTTFTLPGSNGTSGYVLVTDGLGNTSWAVSGGAAGNAAGVDKNIQFNDSGNMAGNAGFNFDKTTDTVSIGIASTTTGKLSFYNASSANATTIQGGNASAAVTYTLPTADGTNGQALITNGSGALSWTTVASGLVVGTSAVSGGTSGRILYDNAGTLGEKAVTGSGDVVLATSPTLVTPVLGTPASGNFSSGTFTWPTFNQNTTGTAAGLSSTLAVASGGTGLTSGTSGGVLYYSASGTLASSSALAANALVIGGGSGTGPSTITTGTGVVTALGVNTGSAGAFVVNGGALGTPSSGTLSSCTGLPLSTGVTGTLATANGGTGLTGFTAANNAIYSTSSSALTAGTLPVAAGGTGLTSLTSGYIPYGNGTGAFSSSSNFTFNGTTDLIVPKEIYSSTTTDYIRVAGGNPNANGAYFLLFGQSHATAPGRLSLRASGSGDVQYTTDTGVHVWFTGGSSERMRIDANGCLGLGTSPASSFYRLDVYSTTDVYGRFYSGGTNTATVFYLTNGNGTTSAKFNYFRFLNNDTNQQDWRLGTYGDNNFILYDAKAASTRLTVDTSGNVLVTGGGGLGYGTGSGGAVTQATSRTTGVTLNKTTGAITLVSAAGSTTAATFTVTNSTVAATDTIIVNQKSGTNKYVILVTAVAAGSFDITQYTTGGTTTEAPVFNFAVIKAVTA